MKRTLTMLLAVTFSGLPLFSNLETASAGTIGFAELQIAEQTTQKDPTTTTRATDRDAPPTTSAIIAEDDSPPTKAFSAGSVVFFVTIVVVVGGFALVLTRSGNSR